MSARLEIPRDDKALLLERSASCRAALQSEMRVLHESLRWPRVVAAAATSPPLRRIAVGLAISLVGTGRVGRLVALAGRALLFAQIARAALRFARAHSSAGAAETASGSFPVAREHRAGLRPG